MRTRNISFEDFGVKRFLKIHPEHDLHSDLITNNVGKLEPENNRIREMFNIVSLYYRGNG